MISWKKRIKKIEDLLKKSTLSSISIVIILAIIVSLSVTDAYSKTKKSVEEVQTLAIPIPDSTDNNQLLKKDISNNKIPQSGDGGNLQQKIQQNHTPPVLSNVQNTNHGISGANQLPEQLAPKPKSKEKLMVVKVPDAKILGKFYLNKAKIEEALNEKVQINLPGSIVLDKIPDPTELPKDGQGDSSSGNQKSDSSGSAALPPMGKLSGRFAGYAALTNKSIQLAGLSDPDNTGAQTLPHEGNSTDSTKSGEESSTDTSASKDLKKPEDSEDIVDIVEAMKEFYTASATELKTGIVTTENTNQIQVSDLTTQAKFNEVMGKILLKSFDLKKNALFKSQDYVDLVYESEFIKKLVKSFGNTTLANNTSENTDAQAFITQLVSNNLLHFALSVEGASLVLEISFSANNGNKETDAITWDSIKNSLNSFATTEGLFTDFPTVAKLLNHIKGTANLAKDASVPGQVAMKKIGSVAAEAADKIYVMVFEDFFIDELKTSLTKENDFLAKAESLQAFFQNLIDNKNKVSYGINGIIHALINAAPQDFYKLTEQFINEVIVQALNTNKSAATNYEEGSVMKELVKALGKESNEGGNYVMYRIYEYLGTHINEEIVGNAFEKFYKDYGFMGTKETGANNCFRILAKSGHQKSFASLAESMVNALNSVQNQMNLVLLVNNAVPNQSASKTFNEGDKSINPALYFELTGSDAELTGEEQSYLYKTESDSYIQFNSVEESILGKLLSVVSLAATKKIRLSVLSTKNIYALSFQDNLNGLATDPITHNEYSNLNTLHTTLNTKVDSNTDTYTINNGSLNIISSSPEFVVAGTLSNMIDTEALKEEFSGDLVFEYMFGAGSPFMWIKSKASKNLGKSALTNIQINFLANTPESEKKFSYEGFYNLLSGRIWYKPGADKIILTSLGSAGVNAGINNIGTALAFLIDPSPAATQMGLNNAEGEIAAAAKGVKVGLAEADEQKGDTLNKPGSYTQAAEAFGQSETKFREIGEIARANTVKAKKDIAVTKAAAMTKAKTFESSGDKLLAEGNHELAAVEFEQSETNYKAADDTTGAQKAQEKKDLALAMKLESDGNALNKPGTYSAAADLFGQSEAKFKLAKQLEKAEAVKNKKTAANLAAGQELESEGDALNKPESYSQAAAKFGQSETNFLAGGDSTNATRVQGKKDIALAKAKLITDAKANISAADVLNLAGKYEEAAALYASAAKQFTDAKDHASAALAMAAQARAWVADNKPEKAADAFGNEGDVWTTLKDHAKAVVAYKNQADTFKSSGNFSFMNAALFEQAGAVHNQNGRYEEAANQFMLAGNAYVTNALYERAAKAYAKAAEAYTATGKMNRVGGAHSKEGDAWKSAKLYLFAAEAYAKAGDAYSTVTGYSSTTTARFYKQAADNYALAGPKYTEQAEDMRTKAQACSNGNCLPVTPKP